MFFEKLKLLEVDKNAEPKPDIAICSKCGWRGPVTECPLGEDGDWETGYFPIDECPECEDGGCVDDYAMSKKRAEEGFEWYVRTEILRPQEAINHG